MSTLQKTKNKIKDDAVFIAASALLIYFISYFFIFIDGNKMKIIGFDYNTALISFLPTIIFLAVLLLFYRFLIK